MFKSSCDITLGADDFGIVSLGYDWNDLRCSETHSFTDDCIVSNKSKVGGGFLIIPWLAE